MHQIEQARVQAFKDIAAQRGILATTLNRQCRDRLGLETIGEFDRLIYRWLVQGHNTIRTQLEKYTPQWDERSDLLKISAFFDNDHRIKPGLGVAEVIPAPSVKPDWPGWISAAIKEGTEGGSKAILGAQLRNIMALHARKNGVDLKEYLRQRKLKFNRLLQSAGATLTFRGSHDMLVELSPRSL